MTHTCAREKHFGTEYFKANPTTHPYIKKLHLLADIIIVGKADARPRLFGRSPNWSASTIRAVDLAQFTMQTPSSFASLSSRAISSTLFSFSARRNRTTFPPRSKLASSILYVCLLVFLRFCVLTILLFHLFSFLFDTASTFGERGPGHSRHFCLLTELNRELNFAGKFLPTVFCGETEARSRKRIKVQRVPGYFGMLRKILFLSTSRRRERYLYFFLLHKARFLFLQTYPNGNKLCVFLCTYIIYRSF